MIDLSILICSTHTRYKTFGPAIQEQVWPQYEALSEVDQARVEIIMLTDNKQMMLGEKRNVLVDMAQGDYVQFVDDDDRIEPDMVKSVLEAIDATHADVITFHASVKINGGASRVCRYSKDFGKDYNTSSEYRRIPNHICCVRRDLARSVSFPNILKGEDSGYSKLLLPQLKTEHAIGRVLYHYDYSDETTETQHQRLGAIRTRTDQVPVADLIILSNAKTDEMRRMTQRTIDTALAGANSLPINVLVLEQQEHKYARARTLHAPEVFNYNRFANRGARSGGAEWIVVANNDLVFQAGWLHQLIAANHPVVSPINPGDPRQSGILEPEKGTTNGRHFSGWCFMIKRSLWERIGGFDEDVSFWCSDDATIEQVKALGIEPMIVPASTVRHLASVTLRSQATPDELTWRNVYIFNQKYGANKFADDPRYIKWRRTNVLHSGGGASE